MDIVYLCKDGPNEELGYSLRTLVNVPHDRVFIVGGCPSNIDKTKVIHVTTEQNINKWRNATNNLITACKDERLSDDFILFNDDFFILKPIKLEDLHANKGPVETVYKNYFEKNGRTSYGDGMVQTAQFLSKMGYKHLLSYELHIPMVMNKRLVLWLFSLPDVMSIQVLHWRTMYGNMYLKDTNTIPDVKVMGPFIAWNYKDNKFLSTLSTSFPSVKKWLADRFPTKSHYEL